MRLPDGVTYHPGEPCLAALDEAAVVRVDTTTGDPANGWYTRNDRDFGSAVAPYLHGEWADFHACSR